MHKSDTCCQNELRSGLTLACKNVNEARQLGFEVVVLSS
jgi:hypothetical protein